MPAKALCGTRNPGQISAYIPHTPRVFSNKQFTCFYSAEGDNRVRLILQIFLYHREKVQGGKGDIDFRNKKKKQRSIRKDSCAAAVGGCGAHLVCVCKSHSPGKYDAKIQIQLNVREL